MGTTDERDEPGAGLLGRVVAAGPDPGHMLDLALGLLVEGVGAERGVLVLLGEGGAPAETVARNIRDAELNGHDFAYSRRIVEEVARTAAPVLVRDASRDPRFRDAESVAGLAIRSVLAVPVAAGLAVLYLDDRAAAGRFDDASRALAERLTLELAPCLALIRDRVRLERKVAGLQAASPPDGAGRWTIVGDSEPMRRLRRDAERAARWHLPLLIEGESGTGKALVARAVHAASERRDGPFVAESCAAISDELLPSELFGHVRGAFSGAVRDRQGLFESASGGTLLLDQAAAMSPALQAALLRVLEEGEVRPLGAEKKRRVDVRLIVSTNEPLQGLVAAGRLREDLLYRLAVLAVRVPPLRERREDVPALLDHFLRRCAHEVGRGPPVIGDAARELLVAYPWPGNVRQLENEVRRLAALGVRRVLPRHLSDEVLAGARRGAGGVLPVELRRLIDEGKTLDEVLGEQERALIAQALAASGGTVAGAARLLGLERTTLLRRARRHGLRAADGGPE
ncbi:MAG: sigma-54-dependent Fis family transcriptional regulator [Planctomycetes bacterium]|nr:sigma-54-dependent Fis family transcriptional regulator [Planctomycetota bacterium]